jgi:hypothetical protein
MVEEAVAHGLTINQSMFAHLACGAPMAGGRHDYVAPDAAGRIHVSLRHVWWLLEWIPKRVKWREWKRRSFLGLYIPNAEPRPIGPDAAIAPSVVERMQHMDYRPENLGPPPSPATDTARLP